MSNWKIEPENKIVSQFINCYWFIEKNKDDTSPDFPRLNPDPAAHLIITEQDNKYHYKNETFEASGAGSHLLYPQCKTVTMNHSGEFRILGIKFQVGALYALGLPKNLVVMNQVAGFDVSHYLQIEDFSESELLKTLSKSPESCRDFLDNRLKAVLTGVDEDRHSKLVRKILKSVSNTALSKIGDAVGCSQRTVERSFSRVTGITLKQYLTMERLEALLVSLYSMDADSIDWADVALEFGFSDQPHLIRYLKSCIGNTPGEYTGKRDLAVDAYGNFQ